LRLAARSAVATTGRDLDKVPLWISDRLLNENSRPIEKRPKGDASLLKVDALHIDDPADPKGAY
jgi:hypothetical protein